MIEASALPFYIVEVVHQVNTELKMKFRENEDIIILVNCNLEKLTISILEVLAIISPQKLSKIKALSQSKKAIQEMMVKTKISNLLAQVKDSPVISKLANYRIEVAQYKEEPSLNPNVLSVSHIKVRDKSRKLEVVQGEIKKTIVKYTEEDITNGESWSMFHRKLCSCKKVPSKLSITSGNRIALLNEDGRGFAMVTGSGCHLPTQSSIFCPSLTAIIKSSPCPQSLKGVNEGSGYLFNTKGLFLKNDQNYLISSLLHKVNNSQRILIGKKTAEFKTQMYAKKVGKQKIPINKIMEGVFSKQSLISFASRTGNEELKLLFQPCCKGGLGIGSFILEPEIKSKTDRSLLDLEQLESVWEYEDGVVPQILQQEKSIMHTAHIKQEIFTSETRTKMKQFLLSDNPGNTL